jgi:hypothetical protein
MKVRDSIDELSDEGEEDQKLKWHKPARKHSYSELLQERFILSIEDSKETPKEICKQLILDGKLIEESEANLRYLVKQACVNNV